MNTCLIYPLAQQPSSIILFMSVHVVAVSIFKLDSILTLCIPASKATDTTQHTVFCTVRKVGKQASPLPARRQISIGCTETWLINRRLWATARNLELPAILPSASPAISKGYDYCIDPPTQEPLRSSTTVNTASRFPGTVLVSLGVVS